MTSEKVHFRILNMRCCYVILCHVNERLPNYCVECGARVYPQVKQWIESDFPEALLRYQLVTKNAE